MPPKVSVNICCYNSEKFIKETIESVLAQTFNDYEAIIIDDGSKDRTGEIIKSFNDPRIKYYYQENRGLSASRNRAIELSQGEYIALLDHDDIWYPNKLEKQMRLFNENPEIGLVFSNCYIKMVRNNKGRLFFRENEDFEKDPAGKLFLKDYIPLFTIIVKKSIFNEIGGFDTNYRSCEDYDFLFRIIDKYRIGHIKEPLGDYILHGSNTYIVHSKKAHEEELQVINHYLNVYPETYKINREAIEQRIARITALLAADNILEGNYTAAKKCLESALKIDKKNWEIKAFSGIFNISPEMAKIIFKIIRSSHWGTTNDRF